jgi:hypothetical protein
MRHAWLVPAGAIALVMAPMVLTRDGFGPDWTNHLWLVWEQQQAIAAMHRPSLFLSADPLGVLYPHFGYYGATAYGATAALAWLLGGKTVVAYCVSWLAGFAMAAAGWAWLSAQLGLRGVARHVPGLIWVTAAYTLTNAYARGAWGEFLATSAMPLVAAGLVALLLAPSLRAGAVLAFAAGIVAFTGSHNITLLWGTLFFGALLLATMPAWWSVVRARVGPRRIAAVAGLGLLAVGVNAWYLLPDIAYRNDVFEGLVPSGPFFDSADFFGRLDVLFDPLRSTPSRSTTPGLAIQLPILALAWAAVAFLRAGAQQRRIRLAMAGTVAVCAVLVVLVVTRAPWDHLPHSLLYIQFRYRLVAYLTFAACLLVTLALVAWQGRPPRPLAVALAIVVLAGCGQALHQIWTVPSFTPDRRAVFADADRAPPSWYDPGTLRFYGAPIRELIPSAKVGFFPRGDSGRFLLAPDPGGVVALDLGAGPGFARLKGVRRLGRTGAGFVVVEVPKSGPPVAVEFEPASSAPVVAGRWISVVSLIGLLALTAAAALRSRLGRR